MLFFIILSVIMLSVFGSLFIIGKVANLQVFPSLLRWRPKIIGFIPAKISVIIINAVIMRYSCFITIVITVDITIVIAVVITVVIAVVITVFIIDVFTVVIIIGIAVFISVVTAIYCSCYNHYYY